MSKAWANGSSSRWRKIRHAILNRDGWTCQQCGTRLDPARPRHHPQAPQVHHILGRALTGDEDARYLEAVCRTCNLDAGDPNDQPDPAHRPITRW